MGYADLIRQLQALPEAKQADVFDFVELLVKQNQTVQPKAGTLAQSPLAKWILNPLVVNDFKPLSREEANER
ncbi:hypothetical protein DIC66_01415 [Rhodoferax lacus]|uniref:DUF2281 domain-containing protein n=1 Tax=Rhodoferax lacus TaxID=2184758 RepID=A0A3E1RHT8_9BURK|nr:DUF2281 domain-containing protein [Rhodoferax lacus]RFO98572.1 hypothetical protein DIC66_01415 [Rhodoferax lacus]